MTDKLHVTSLLSSFNTIIGELNTMGYFYSWNTFVTQSNNNKFTEEDKCIALKQWTFRSIKFKIKINYLVRKVHQKYIF